MTDDRLPAELRRLWRIPARSRRGRPAELDVERVVRAAIGLADGGGLDAVSLPRVAAELGVTAMSLYRHVGSKAELLGLIEDAGAGPPPRIDTSPPQWRSGLREWASAMRLLYHRRPWLPRIPVAGPPAGPHQIAWMEVALHVLRGTALDPAAKLGVVTLVSGYVRTAALLAQDLEPGWLGGPDHATNVQPYGRSLAQLVDPARFPQMAALLSSGIFEDPPPETAGTDPDFAFGLDRILDGIAAIAG